jgi:CheY-like chemotaxis protein
MPNFRPDVLIVDIAMPGLSGAEVLEALRRSGSAVPVVAISGQASVAEEGFFAVMLKPFSVALIVRTVAAALGQGEAPKG